MNFANRLSFAAAVCCVAVVLTGCNKESAPTASEAAKPAAPARIRLAVIPKGTTHVFWKSVEAGARQAGQELGVDISWKGPLKENDRAQQIDIVEQFLSEGVSGIVLAPLDDTALVRPVHDAMAKGIPVAIIDSRLKGEAGKDFISIVSTDNRLGGKLAGEEMAKQLGGKGRVVMLRYQEGSASTTEREEGFMEAIKAHPEIHVVLDNRYAGATVGEAQTTAMNIIDKIREADGVFTPNESSTFGMLLALRQNQLAGKIKFIGFDTSPPLVDALKKGEIQALVAQNPTKMGYEGVKTMVAHLNGGKVPASVDSGIKLVTPETLNTPEVRQLLGL